MRVVFVAETFDSLADSTNFCRPIAQSAITLLQGLFASLPVMQVAQHLCKVCQHDKEKLRVTALRYLADNMRLFCGDSEVVVAVVKK